MNNEAKALALRVADRIEGLPWNEPDANGGQLQHAQERDEERGMSEQCSNCRFWQQNENYRGSGTCRVKPAVVRLEHDRGFHYVWPETRADDWCGKWERKVGGKHEPSVDEMRQTNHNLTMVIDRERDQRREAEKKASDLWSENQRLVTENKRVNRENDTLRNRILQLESEAEVHTREREKHKATEKEVVKLRAENVRLIGIYEGAEKTNARLRKTIVGLESQVADLGG